MSDILQTFADTVDSLCSDYDNHHIDPDYEFYGGLTVRMLVNACKNLKDAGEVEFPAYWIE